MGNANYTVTTKGVSADITAVPQTVRDMISSGIELKDCKDKCDSDVSCNGFIYATSTKKCKFFNKVSAPYFHPDETTVLKNGTPHSTSTSYINTNVNAATTKSVTNATVEAAANAAAAKSETIPKPNPENNKKLSTAAIVGISLGSIAGAILLFCLVWYFLIRKQ